MPEPWIGLGAPLVVAAIVAAVVFHDFWYRFGARFDGASFIKPFRGGILLTYDDGPASERVGWGDGSPSIEALREAIVESDPDWDFSESTTVNLLRTLREFDSRAVFFVRGDVLAGDERARKDLKRIHGCGHAVGNHSFAHARLETCSPQRSVDEMAAAHSLISGIIGTSPVLFRPPYGKWHVGRTLRAWRRPALKSYCLPVGWTHSTADWTKTDQDLSPAALQRDVDGLLEDIRCRGEGAILLQHDVWVYSALFTRRLLQRVRQEPGLTVIEPAEFVRYAVTRTKSARWSFLLGYYLRERVVLLHKRWAARSGA